jgi:hypothetical protein
VIAERAANAFASLGQAQTTFNYVPLHDWRQLFAKHGVHEVEVIDLSQGIAEFLKVSDINVLRDEYFAPRMLASFGPEATEQDKAPLPRFVELMVQVANEYRRLSRLLRGGMLQYVLMRWRKG